MNTKKIPFIPRELRDEMKLHSDKIRKEMDTERLDAILIASNSNIYYTAGRFFRGYVYVPAEGETLYFVIRPTIFEDDDNVITIRKPEMIAECLKQRGVALPSTVGLEFNTLSYSEIKRLEGCFPGAEFFNASGMVANARMTKTPYEVEEIRCDGRHQAEVYRRISGLYKENMTDLEFQIEIERVLRLEGCIGMLRTSGNLMESGLGSVINGDNADNPSPYDYSMGGAGIDNAYPVGADGKTMLAGTTVMVDMAGSFNGYQSDMTRVWSIGEIPEIALKAHDCSIRILRELERLALPGTEVNTLYRRAEEIAAEEGLADYFMGHRQKAGFIGHGVGIELNEPPAITAKNKTLLEAGMVVALEPKFVIPGTGAVGPENTYVVKSDGLEPLTIFPEKIEDLL